MVMWVDAECSTVKSMMSGRVTGKDQDAEMFRLITGPESLHEKTDDELMILGEGITGRVRYGPDSDPGHCLKYRPRTVPTRSSGH